MEKTIRSLGKGVTPQAQDIFDALEKTMPCEWKDTNIEVFGEVMIDSPYTLELCHFKEGSSRNAMMMDRVQTVLSEELKRKPTSCAEATTTHA
jgi:protein LSM12